MSAWPEACRARRVEGDTGEELESVEESGEEEISASCSARRRCCWASAKEGMARGMAMRCVEASSDGGNDEANEEILRIVTRL